MNDFVKYLLWFVCLVLLQEFLFNNIQFIHFLSPYIYIFLILILPFNMHPSYVMLISFGLGLSVDIISAGILGAHAAACTAVAFCRNFIIKITIPRVEYESISTSTAMQIKLKIFVLYAFPFVFLHHFILFLLEILSLDNFIFTFVRILVSSIISTVFIILIKHLFNRKTKRNIL
jgi:rod shape-determining protein MreD